MGTRTSIAYALLMIPGVVDVGLADASADRRVPMFNVEICIRFEGMSMTNSTMAAADQALLEAEVDETLDNTLPAGVAANVRYQLV